jgi:RNA polymerase sigma-70 factor (ECF subfamily)
MPPDEPSPEIPLGRFRRWLRKLARRKIKGELKRVFDDSDAFQETMIKVDRHSREFAGMSEGAKYRWLSQIMDNVVIDAARRLLRGGAGKTQSLDQLADDSQAPRTNEPEFDGTSPSQKVVRTEEQSLLAEVLKELPERERTLVTLHHFESLSIPEIADRTGATEAAVYAVLYRARRALREKMDKANGEVKGNPDGDGRGRGRRERERTG